MSEVRVAVVGLGFGRQHVERLGGLGGRAVLDAVVDPVAPADNRSLDGAPAREAILAADHFPSLTALLAERTPDVVAIATPIHTHLPLAEQALAAGAHVLLEKPPTATLAEHQRLVAAADAAGRAVQIGFQARGSEALTAARDAVADGVIGDVLGLGVLGLWQRSVAYYGRAAWAGRRTLDGVTVMDGVVTNPLAHSVDTALAIVGALRVEDVEDVRIDAWHAHDIEADDTSSAVIRTARGTSIGIGLTVCAPSSHAPVVTVYGTDGEVRVSYTNDRIEIVTADGASSSRTLGRAALLDNLVDHVTDGVPLLCPVEETGAFMRVLEAARVGAAPRPIGAEWVTWQGAGPEAQPVVTDVDRWCAAAAREARTFTELGAPWTR